MMEPIGLEYSGKKGYIIVHRCRSCGEVRRNRAALEDPVPDTWDLLITLSTDPCLPDPPRGNRENPSPFFRGSGPRAGEE